MLEYLGFTVNVIAKTFSVKIDESEMKADDKFNLIKKVLDNDLNFVNEFEDIDKEENDFNFRNKIIERDGDYFLFRYHDIKKVMSVQRNGLEAPETIITRKHMIIYPVKEDNIDEVTVYFINTTSRTFKIASSFISSLVGEEISNPIEDISMSFITPDYYHEEDVVFSIFQNEVDNIKSINVEPRENEYITSISMRGKGNDITDFYSDPNTYIKSIKGAFTLVELSSDITGDINEKFKIFTDVTVKRDCSFSFKIPKKMLDMLSFGHIKDFINDTINKLYKVD